MKFDKGDKVKGIFSGRYLGTVIGFAGSDLIVRGPDNTVIFCSRVMMDLIPERIEGDRSRVWVV